MTKGMGQIQDIWCKVTSSFLSWDNAKILFGLRDTEHQAYSNLVNSIPQEWSYMLTSGQYVTHSREYIGIFDSDDA